jgi:predicted ATPase/serine/threonine protein kinase
MEQSNPGDASASTLVAGSRFGEYKIIERLGAGGMGEVFRALDTRLGREVALKTIRIERGGEEDAIRRFEQEARSASSLNHPNIVTIYELGTVDSARYIAMELLEGGTLREHLAGGAIPFHRVISIASQLGEALAKAHEIGIVHRDIKPENLIIAEGDRPKICDFGLAKLTHRAPKSMSDSSTQELLDTATGAIVGSFVYMSPEQARGDDVDFRSDQFAFGSVLFEMISGKPPFRRKTMAETLVAIMNEQPTPLRSLNLNVPAPFLWIVERCLSKDPAERYGSTRDLARDLAAVRDRVAAGPARAHDAHPSGLPAQRTPFIGREKEVAWVRALMQRPESQLITLTGPGGIGKTRLALQVAAEESDAFPGGIGFAPLATATDESSVLTAIAQAVGIQALPGQSIWETLQEHLRTLEHATLIVLDNFEHLVSFAPLIADSIAASPKLKVIVTSQSRLHVYGELEFPVPPLGTADPSHLPPLNEFSKMPAIALFLERAQAVKRDFYLTPDNAKAIAAICHRLDGLPLAIELAAARVKLLSPAAMQSRLESSLNLLTGGARDLPTRQQTLRATIDWSYHLLNEAEQKLFRRLSVFIGGCTLESAEAVCDTRGDLGIDLLEGMASMMDKSLLRQVNTSEQEQRFVMLSTIREYALERLHSGGDETETRRAHAAYYIVLAEESIEAADPSQWLARFDAELEDFRSALDFLIKRGEVAWGLRLGNALFRYWEAREFLTEGRERLAALLALPHTPQDAKARARTLFGSSVLAGEQGDYSVAQSLSEACVATARAVEDHHCLAVALNAMAVNARDRGDIAGAIALFEENLTIWRGLGDNGATARAISNLASTYRVKGDYARAGALYDECMAIFWNLGDQSGVAWSLNSKGDLARAAGDPASARALQEQSLDAFRRLGDRWGIASTLNDLGNLQSDAGEHEQAQRLYAESLKHFRELAHQRGVARCLESFARSAAAQGRAEFALKMAGAAAAIRQRMNAPLTPSEQSRLESSLAEARQKVGSDQSSFIWLQGWGMSPEEAANEALSHCGSPEIPQKAAKP